MKKDFVAVGYSCIDEYQTMNISYPTGNGINIAIQLADAGFSTAVVTAVGDDEYGKIFINKLVEKNIDISHVHMVKGGSTAKIQMELIDGDRRHVKVKDGVMANFHLTKSDFIFIQEFKYLHTDYFGRIYGLLEFFQMRGIKTVFDFSIFLNDKDIETILPFVDIGLFSINDVSNKSKERLKNFQRKGMQIAIATAGSKGAVAYDGRKFYFEPAIKVANIINTVGAGDSFLAGFLSGNIKNMSIRNCLLSGVDSASKAVQRFAPY